MMKLLFFYFKYATLTKLVEKKYISKYQGNNLMKNIQIVVFETMTIDFMLIKSRCDQLNIYSKADCFDAVLLVVS